MRKIEGEKKAVRAGEEEGSKEEQRGEELHILKVTGMTAVTLSFHSLSAPLPVTCKYNLSVSKYKIMCYQDYYKDSN